MANSNLDTLEQPINEDFTDDRNTKVVRTVLDLIDNSRTILRDPLNRKETLQEELDRMWEVIAPQGTNQFPAFLMFQLLFNIVTQMRPLDVQLESETADEATKRRVSAGVSWVMGKGGFTDELTQNYGGFWQQVGLGDYFMQVGAKENGLPEFRSCEIIRMYFDKYATRLNTNGTGRCTRAVVIFEYSWDEALALYPQLKDKGTSGEIPTVDQWTEFDGLEQDEYIQQGQQNDNRSVQIAHYYDISDKPRYTILAGKGATILFDQKGEDYQFYTGEGKTRENYIPFLQFITYPTREGIFNAGVLHLVYPIAMKMKELLNKASNHIADNMNPTRIMSIPKQQAPKFLNRLRDAKEMEKAGQKPFVINDFGGGDASQLGVLETLQAANMTADFERLMNQFDKEVRRFGFNVDRTFSNPNKPLGSVEIDEENQGETIRQIQEQNVRSYRDASLYTIDMVTKNIKDDDETATSVAFKSVEEKREDQKLAEEGIEIGTPVYTLGNLSEDLKAHEWIVTVNARTGKYPSQNLERIRLTRLENKLLARGAIEQANSITEKLALMDGIQIGLVQQDQGGVPAQEEGPKPQAEQGILEEVLG